MRIMLHEVAFRGQRDANYDFIFGEQWASAASVFLIFFKCQNFSRHSPIGYQFLGYLEDRYRPAFVFRSS